MTVALIYENEDNTSSMRETIMEYDEGDITDMDTWYPILNETNVENLEERDRLYSDSLSSIEIEMRYQGLRNSDMEKTFYLQIHSPEDLAELIG